jgi:hypothetical protein
MPEPRHGETLGAFVSKYVTSKEAKRKFPKKPQREAVAYSEGERAKLKK